MNEEDIFADILGDNKLTDDESFEDAAKGNKGDIFDETDEQDEEKPAKSQTEKDKEKEESPSQEGEDDSEEDEDSDDNTTAQENTPFHKRWAKREQKLTEDFDKKIADLKGEINKPVEDTDVQMPQWFKTLAGDDEIAQSAFKQYQAETRKSQTDLKKQWVEEQNQEIEQQKQETQKWNEWVDDEVDRLKGEGKKFNKKELLEIAVKYTPTGDDGQISIDKAYDIYQMQKTSKKDPSAAKKKAIVSDSNSTSGPDVPSAPIKNIRNQSWSDLAI